MQTITYVTKLKSHNISTALNSSSIIFKSTKYHISSQDSTLKKLYSLKVPNKENCISQQH